MIRNYAALPLGSGNHLRWLKANGGVEAADKRAHERAEVLYAEIDRNKLFKGTVEEASRSLMNIKARNRSI